MTTLLVVPPGLESILLQELQEKWQLLNEHGCVTGDLPEVRKIVGGLELDINEKMALYLSYYLKIPSKIYWRVCNFSATDFPKLYKSLKSVDWSKYLVENQISFSVSSSKSRLKIIKKIESTLLSAVSDRFNGSIIKSETAKSHFHLRIYQDQCELSYLLSGKESFKRFRKYSSKAPLRENLASIFALLFWQQDLRVVCDPFCGSGTIPLSILDYYQRNPLQLADHDISWWKQFTCKQITSLKKEEPLEIYFNDIDSVELENVKNNFANFSTTSKVHFSCSDALEFLNQLPKECFLVSNLPYEKRANLQKLSLNDISLKLSKWTNFCLIGRDSLSSLKKESKVSVLCEFRNGGHPVSIVSF